MTSSADFGVTKNFYGVLCSSDFLPLLKERAVMSTVEERLKLHHRRMSATSPACSTRDSSHFATLETDESESLAEKYRALMCENEQRATQIEELKQQLRVSQASKAAATSPACSARDSSRLATLDTDESESLAEKYRSLMCENEQRATQIEELKQQLRVSQASKAATAEQLELYVQRLNEANTTVLERDQALSRATAAENQVNNLLASEAGARAEEHKLQSIQQELLSTRRELHQARIAVNGFQNTHIESSTNQRDLDQLVSENGSLLQELRETVLAKRALEEENKVLRLQHAANLSSSWKELPR
jgi:uncharacterized protein YbaR (Trm112 family)